MNKKWIFLLLFFIGIFLISVNVEAANLTKNNLTVECIYSDGSLITYSNVNGITSVTRDPAEIVSETEENNNISEFYIINKNSILTDGNWCRAYLLTATKSIKVTEECVVDADGDEDCDDVDPYIVTAGYYKTSSKNNGTITNGEIGNTKPWFYVFVDSDEYNNSPVKNFNRYDLVSERIFLEDDTVLDNLADKNKCYFVKKANQAAGRNSYLTMYIFGNTTLVENNGSITSLGVNKINSCPKSTIYFNDPSRKIDVTKSSPRYVYDFPRFMYKNKQDNSYNQKFEVTTAEENQNAEKGKNACESIPETVKVLKNIIGILQIGVPAFTIVLTSIDIFRMVVAGNLDEELPKRKKSIIIRLIIMLVFIFLPLFINVGLQLLYDNSSWFEKEVGIKDIDCLFE